MPCAPHTLLTKLVMAVLPCRVLQPSSSARAAPSRPGHDVSVDSMSRLATPTHCFFRRSPSSPAPPLFSRPLSSRCRRYAHDSRVQGVMAKMNRLQAVLKANGNPQARGGDGGGGGAVDCLTSIPLVPQRHAGPLPKVGRSCCTSLFVAFMLHLLLPVPRGGGDLTGITCNRPVAV